ncbi:SDR family NAD(P)-dependent oxidoreductase [Amycolatopsis sp. FDAARGOS 1241]|uniref:SDR family NAD(P)-dependent oxidoreductase n=1 Tax=Amycolatopsis sp. FDAARGOS 1241 TaxID=2778070 RepID=UPI0019509283|nr:SDR family NAD(P)-dependent oxidoreductase [Amycolatopsis sp. FDAARGOS 1241]QRP47565.1 SDR family NAD(P)-dependent oxidoreductase [Amycolatopsis sp. FDAARGOS 1241]
MPWNPEQLPDLGGRTYAVTGGSAGIGYFISEQLTGAGAHVILLGRSPERLAAAVETIKRHTGSGEVSTIRLDLADLDSVREAAGELGTRDRVDALIENAGSTSPGRTRHTTKQGFELAVGTNHLGHFALTALAMPALTTWHARIVPMGSLITRLAPFALDDLLTERKYSQSRAYANSKHAVQSFGFELDRRLRAAGSKVECILAHPGFSLDRASPRREHITEPKAWLRLAAPVTQGKDRGAWPAVRAAVDPGARGGQFYGPARGGVGEPVLKTAVEADRDPAIAAKLWTRSEELTGIEFTVG